MAEGLGDWAALVRDLGGDVHAWDARSAMRGVAVVERLQRAIGAVVERVHEVSPDALRIFKDLVSPDALHILEDYLGHI